jgi:hypothetical protein
MRKSYYLWVVHIPIPAYGDMTPLFNYAPHAFTSKATAKQFIALNKKSPEFVGATIVKYKKEK